MTGWNEAKRTCGADVAEAHGGWKPGSSSRYSRFSLRKDIFGISAAMVAPRADALEDASDDEGAPRAITPRTLNRRGRADEVADSDASDDPEVGGVDDEPAEGADHGDGGRTGVAAGGFDRVCDKVFTSDAGRTPGR